MVTYLGSSYRLMTMIMVIVMMMMMSKNMRMMMMNKNMMMMISMTRKIIMTITWPIFNLGLPCFA